MKKLFGLFLLAASWFAPDVAFAANRFLTCNTTCTITAADTSIWGSTSGGTGASVPGSGDAVIMDAATCVGGTTCTATFGSGYNPTWQSITWGACTASTTGCIIDASVNNNNITLSSGGGTLFSGSGTGTRKWLAGSGTYNLTITNTNGCFSMATKTNDQGSDFSGATWNCTVTATNISTAIAGGGFSFGPTTINGNTGFGQLSISGANTFSSLTINAPNFVAFPQSTTTTITNALTANGSSSNQIMLTSTNIDTIATISLGAASTASWAAMRVLTTSGASKLDVTNCFNLGRITLANSGSCTAPSGGGAGGGRIIGG